MYAEAAIRWWLRELWDWLPSTWQSRLARNEPIIIEARHGATGADIKEYAATKSPLVAVPGFAEGVLLVDPNLAYVRSIELPLLSTRDTAHIVEFEARRHSPLPFDSIYYDYRITWRSLRSHRQGAEIVFLRRDTLDRANDFAQSISLRLSAVCINAPKELVRLTRLLREPWYRGWLSSSQQQLARRCAVAVAYACLALTVAWIRVQTLRASTQSELDAARIAAEPIRHAEIETNRLLRQIELVNAASKKSQPVRDIEEVASLLPDSAWLTHLDLKGDGIEMRGVAQKASALINTFSRSNVFRQVTFSGPITREPARNLEDFELSILLR